MADKLTDQQIADLSALLAKNDAPTDAKVTAVNAVKSGIKQHNVPETGVPLLFDALRTASASQHAVLTHAGFSSLNHLLTRLSRQEPKFIVKEAMRTMPVVVEKLGDPKEKLRAIATQALTTMYGAAATEVERGVRNTAMTGKNSRAKEASMHWLVAMHRDHGLPFRAYVPLLMDLLEDADGMVRDVAKTTVIELFKTAPNAAKSDLKRQLKNFKVRPAIEQAIVKALAPTPGERSETPSDPLRPKLATHSSSTAAERPTTPMLDRKGETVEPMYVNTKGELDEIIRDMHYWFEGKETEQNWLKREESMGTLRRLIAGNVSDFHDTFLNGVRGLLDGIIKGITSLRTSLSKEGCALVQDVANAFGSAIDPMVELLMQTLLKLSAATKKISSQLASSTIDIILSKATFNNRLLQHICSACHDKNVQPRLYATGWLKTMMIKEEQHKTHIENTGGLDLIEKSIKKGLGDANPGVREKMRATYWTFAGIWPARAEVIMDNLDSTAQKLLQKDPNNPNSPKKGAAPTTRPGQGLSRSTMGTGKPSLRETVMAQKKASLAAKNLPTRPGSAMSAFSPVKNSSNGASGASEPSKPVKLRQRPESTLAVNSGGMSVAPMRPTKRRPELAARPATAGPYSVRSHGGPSTEANSPSEKSKPKAAPPKPTAASPRRAPRPRSVAHASHASEPNLPSPTRPASNKAPSPRATPISLRKAQSSPASGSSAAAEELTLVVPSLANLKISSREGTPDVLPPSVPSPILETPTPASETFPAAVSGDSPAKTLQVYEDPFVEGDATPKATPITGPVLEDKPVNENAAPARPATPENQEQPAPTADVSASPDKTRQNSRLLDSGVTRIKARTLDVHGFRKLQSLIRDNKAVLTSEKFEALLLGLFGFLQDPLEGTAPERAQDVKSQILGTIKLLLKKERSSFQPFVSVGLEALLQARSAHDARTYIVSGLELLADELVALGDASELVMTLTAFLSRADDGAPEGCRALSMGTHVLRQLLEARAEYVPSETELANLAALQARCLVSADSGVRRDAVQLCVAMHARLGEREFWRVMAGLGEDPKNLITYYVVKKQREQAV